MTKTAFFTVCNLAYLHKAAALAESIFKNCHQKLYIIVFDACVQFNNPSEHAEIIWAETLNFANFEYYAFIYDVIELTTAFKPSITLYFLENHEQVIFLDPDTYVYSSLSHVQELLLSHPVVLTPHDLTPQPASRHESDTAMMRFGSFNLGFYGVNNHQSSFSFLYWWQRRCLDLCFKDSQFGLSTDQKWVTIAPALFENIYISFDEGLNFAPWNTFERQLSRDRNLNNRILVNGSTPLAFIHYSNYNINDPQYMLKRASNEHSTSYPILEELSTEYGARLAYYKALYPICKYKYDYFDNDQYINPLLRLAVASHFTADQISKPFRISSLTYKFAKTNRLLDWPKVYYGAHLRRTSKEARSALRIAYFVLKIAVWLLGPFRYYYLLNAFAYLSSPRLHPMIWKVPDFRD